MSLLHSARPHRRNPGRICVICTAERNSFCRRVYLSQKHQGPRGVVLLILMFVCFLCFLRDRIVNAITGGGESRKRERERITPLCCRFSSRSQFHRSARPRPPLPPPHVDTHAITRAIKKCREIKCAKAYGFLSCSKAFFLLLF